MDFELTDFFVHCNFIPDAISGKCGELALHVFWTLVFAGSLEGKFHQGHFLPTKGFLLVSHSSRENGVTWKSSRT